MIFPCKCFNGFNIYRVRCSVTITVFTMPLCYVFANNEQKRYQPLDNDALYVPLVLLLLIYLPVVFTSSSVKFNC